MSTEFLRRLFTACDESASVFVDGRNMSELYQRLEETKQSDRAVTAAVESTELDRDKKAALESAYCDLSDAYELQGFINGFRLCALLQHEIGWPIGPRPQMPEGRRDKETLDQQKEE